MIYSATHPVQLKGVGHYFPGNGISNSEFVDQNPMLAIDEQWIIEHTGVLKRYYPTDGEYHIDMAEIAAFRALEHAHVMPKDIDAIIAVSATARPSVNPSTSGNRYMDVALPLQDRLGASKATTFDVSGVACCGFLFASYLASRMITGDVKNILVVCVENPVPILNFKYKYSALFGAGAAAALWCYESTHMGIESVSLRSDSKYYNAFDIDDENKMIMRGGIVGELAPIVLSEIVNEILSHNSIEWNDIDWIIPHQSNLNIVDKFVEMANVPDRKILINIRQRGNVSSVGVPGCLSEFIHKGVIRPTQRILSFAIGRGFTWGAMIYSYGLE